MINEPTQQEIATALLPHTPYVTGALYRSNRSVINTTTKQILLFWLVDYADEVDGRHGFMWTCEQVVAGMYPNYSVDAASYDLKVKRQHNNDVQRTTNSQNAIANKEINEKIDREKFYLSMLTLYYIFNTDINNLTNYDRLQGIISSGSQAMFEINTILSRENLKTGKQIDIDTVIEHLDTVDKFIDYYENVCGIDVREFLQDIYEKTPEGQEFINNNNKITDYTFGSDSFVKDTIDLFGYINDVISRRDTLHEDHPDLEALGEAEGYVPAPMTKEELANSIVEVIGDPLYGQLDKMFEIICLVQMEINEENGDDT